MNKLEIKMCCLWLIISHESLTENFCFAFGKSAKNLLFKFKGFKINIAVKSKILSDDRVKIQIERRFALDPMDL